MNFTSTSEIKARVYELYLTEDQELNSNFFDFHVRNLRSTLLKTYAEIQKAINEDAVVLLKNSIETRHGSEIQVNGILSSHNHPSGHLQPSKYDVDSTKNIVNAGRTIGIPLVDHLIIGDGRYVSLLEEYGKELFG